MGNDVAGFVDDNGVADAEIKAGDFVGVVEAGVADGAAGNHDGVKQGDGSGGAGATDRDDDVADAGGGLFGGKLEGNGGARGLADDAEGAIDGAVIDFDHHAIGVKGEGLAVVGEAGDFLEDLV